MSIGNQQDDPGHDGHRPSSARFGSASGAVPDAAVLVRLHELWRRARRRILFLDYDGTLRELTPRPEHAVPTPDLLALLQELLQVPGTNVHVVSGRSSSSLAAWFGSLRVHLCAEHGFTLRGPDGDWLQPYEVDLGWMPAVRKLFERATGDLPGSFVEQKRCGFAWHYRLADSGHGARFAQELQQHLDRLLATQPAETLAGHAVLEVRPKGIDKGTYVARFLPDADDDDLVICAGDDRTDEDMYRRMPAEAFVVNVGCPAPGAANFVASPAELRTLLRSLLERAPELP